MALRAATLACLMSSCFFLRFKSVSGTVGSFLGLNRSHITTNPDRKWSISDWGIMDYTRLHAVLTLAPPWPRWLYYRCWERKVNAHAHHLTFDPRSKGEYPYGWRSSHLGFQTIRGCKLGLIPANCTFDAFTLFLEKSEFYGSYKCVLYNAIFFGGRGS